MAAEVTPPTDPKVVRVAETGAGKFQQAVFAAGHRLTADEPAEFGGLGSGPSPYDFLAAALAACTSMTLRMYAERRQLGVGRITVHVSHSKIHAKDCAECVEGREGLIDRFERIISVDGAVTPGRLASLQKTSRGPMRISLMGGLLTICAMVSAAGCVPEREFDTRGLVLPPAECGVDPKTVAEASQLDSVIEGNGCQIPNPWRVTAVSGVNLDALGRFRKGAILNCGVVDPLNRWVEGVAQPAARQAFGEPIRSMKVGSYFCRARNNARGAKISEHGLGNAIDFSEFTLASGRTIAVTSGWNGTPEERAFLRELGRGACPHFTTVLSPDSDPNHQGHFHFDLAQRPGGERLCQ